MDVKVPKEANEVVYLMMSMYSAWFLGYFSFHFSYLVLLLIILHRMGKKHTRKMLARRARELDEEQMSRKEVLPAEECQWLNSFVEKILVQASERLSEQTEATLKEILHDFLAQSKPPSVDSITVEGISFGTVAPKVQKARTFVRPEEFKWDFDVVYLSEFKIVVKLALGGKFLHVTVPIQIQDIEIEGRMRLHMDFADKPPYVNTVDFGFKSTPRIAISIKPLKAFDIGNMPWVNSWLVDTITSIIVQHLVLPNRIVLNLQAKESTGESGLISVERKNKEIIESEMRKTSKREKSLKRVLSKKLFHKSSTTPHDYSGLLKVVVVEATGLKACDRNGFSDPYCIIECGDKKRKTKVIKRTLSPCWNEEVDFLVESGGSDGIQITVMDWNSLTEDDLIGVGTVSMQDLQKAAKDIWVPIKSKKEDTGQVHLSLSLVPVE